RAIWSGVVVGATVGLISTTAFAVDAKSEQEIVAAIGNAKAGDVLHIAKGKYSFTSAIWTAAGGAPGSPITLTAERVGDAELDFASVEGLVIDHPYWIIEKIWLNGVCAGGCGGGAAGLHIKPTADHFIVRNSRLSNYSEIIKVDRTATGAGEV